MRRLTETSELSSIRASWRNAGNLPANFDGMERGEVPSRATGRLTATADMPTRPVSFPGSMGLDQALLHSIENQFRSPVDAQRFHYPGAVHGDGIHADI